MSASPMLSDISMLVVEPLESENSPLIQLLDNVAVRGTRIVVESVNEALRKLANEEFRLCILSDAVETSEQVDFIKELGNSNFGKNTATISLIPKSKQNELIALLQAGAHAVELTPSNEQKIEKAILRASYKLLERIRLSGDPKEQVTNISWLLERVANRLEQLADKIESGDSANKYVSANPKLVKEALLSSVGASGSDDEQFSEDFIKWLEGKLKK